MYFTYPNLIAESFGIQRYYFCYYGPSMLSESGSFFTLYEPRLMVFPLIQATQQRWRRVDLIPVFYQN